MREGEKALHEALYEWYRECHLDRCNERNIHVLCYSLNSFCAKIENIIREENYSPSVKDQVKMLAPQDGVEDDQAVFRALFYWLENYISENEAERKDRKEVMLKKAKETSPDYPYIKMGLLFKTEFVEAKTSTHIYPEAETGEIHVRINGGTFTNQGFPSCGDTKKDSSERRRYDYGALSGDRLEIRKLAIGFWRKIDSELKRAAVYAWLHQIPMSGIKSEALYEIIHQYDSNIKSNTFTRWAERIIVRDIPNYFLNELKFEKEELSREYLRFFVKWVKKCSDTWAANSELGKQIAAHYFPNP